MQTAKSTTFKYLGIAQDTKCFGTDKVASNEQDLKHQPCSTRTHLQIGQVVVFDSVCVIDTKTTTELVQPPLPDLKHPNKGGEDISKCSKTIDVKKVIYMVATKVTKIDDCKIGGTGDIIGMYRKEN